MCLQMAGGTLRVLSDGSVVIRLEGGEVAMALKTREVPGHVIM